MLSAAMLAAGLLLHGGEVRAEPGAPDGQIMGTKEDRILWIFPNFRTVEQKEAAPSITNMDKFRIAAKDSFDPYAFPVAAGYAGLAHLTNEYPSWGGGLDGYGHRYVGAFADQTMANMMAGAVFPILLHQDPRYFRLGTGGVAHRTGYAATRIFITRSDSGRAQFNYSEIAGTAVMAGASNLYYPRQDRSWENTASKIGIQLGLNMIGNICKEFWPDVKGFLVR
jgi:hypothetical protein